MSHRRRYGKFGPIVGAIDEGTFSTRFMAFAANTSEVLTYHQVGLESSFPKDGWVEQDPMAILNAVEQCLEETINNMVKLDINPQDMVAIGLANQRETTVLWDKFTGKPLYNAISWMDTRTSVTVDCLLSKLRNKNADIFKPLCGLPINPYFSALKIKWLIDNVEEVRRAIEDRRCLFGTIDSWIIWNLTGGPQGGVHITDVTNASRTMLMNLTTLAWDKTLCEFFAVPCEILPSIYSSSEIYGYISHGPLIGVPISGLVESQHGLLTTVAYQFGPRTPPVYALEGSIAGAGSTLKWLRDNLNLFQDDKETKDIMTSCDSNGEIYFVPAFYGLHAPYWRKNARSVICGIVESTTKAHIVKAAMEAICFQTRDILEAMRKDCGVPLQRLLVDGGMTVNGFLMQLQADLCGIPVVRATISETTALGAAIVAGMAEGIKVWDLVNSPTLLSDSFFPIIGEDERDLKYHRWKMAVERCLAWQPDKAVVKNKDVSERTLRAAAAPALFVVISLATLILANFARST